MGNKQAATEKVAAKEAQEIKADAQQDKLPSASSPQEAPSTSSSVAAQPAPSSVFEFGPLVTVGQDVMRGVCTGDNPDAIHACSWSIEPAVAQGKARDKKHLYRVEF